MTKNQNFDSVDFNHLFYLSSKFSGGISVHKKAAPQNKTATLETVYQSPLNSRTYGDTNNGEELQTQHLLMAEIMVFGKVYNFMVHKGHDCCTESEILSWIQIGLFNWIRDEWWSLEEGGINL